MSGSFGQISDLSVQAEDRLHAQVENPPGYWFAVQTRYRFEKKVASQLSQKNLRVYLPLRTEKHTWSDRRATVTIPLFQGYAFVHIDPSQAVRQAVLQTAGLIGFVSFGGTVVPVPDQQIEHLKLLLQQKVPFTLHPFAQVGRRVRIRGGSLHGLEGVLLQRDRKIVISIEAVQRSVSIELRGYELDLV